MNQTGLVRREDLMAGLQFPPILVDSKQFYQRHLKECCPHRVFKPFGFSDPMRPDYSETGIFYACAQNDALLEKWTKTWLAKDLVHVSRNEAESLRRRGNPALELVNLYDEIKQLLFPTGEDIDLQEPFREELNAEDAIAAGSFPMSGTATPVQRGNDGVTRTFFPPTLVPCPPSPTYFFPPCNPPTLSLARISGASLRRISPPNLPSHTVFCLSSERCAEDV